MPLVATVAFAFHVARVRIDHVPNRITTRIAIGPAQLSSLATQNADTSDRETIALLVQAAQGLAPSTDPRRADLRYAVTFYDSHGRVQRTIYLDKFGTRGVLDGKAVRFGSDALRRAIDRIFPMFAS